VKVPKLATAQDWVNLLRYGNETGIKRFRRAAAPTTTREQMLQAKAQGFGKGDMSAADMERMILGDLQTRNK
jgi:hypothetical protein